MSEITRLGDLELIGLAARVTNDLTIGEMVEIAHHRKLVEDPAQYFYLIEKKTASLVATACEMGAVIGAPGHREELATYGHRLGMAFQLVDDLMDYGGEQAVMGKPADRTSRRGRPRSPCSRSCHGYRRSSAETCTRSFDPAVALLRMRSSAWWTWSTSGAGSKRHATSPRSTRPARARRCPCCRRLPRGRCWKPPWITF